MNDKLRTIRRNEGEKIIDRGRLLGQKVRDNEAIR